MSIISISTESFSDNEDIAARVAHTFTIQRLGDIRGSSQVDWSISDSNKQATLLSTNAVAQTSHAFGTVHFGPGESMQTIRAYLRGDMNLEVNSQLELLLANPIGTSLNNFVALPHEQTATSVLPQISFVQSIVSKAEGNADLTIFEYTVKRTGDLSLASTVDWSVSGSGSNPATLDEDIYTQSNAAFGTVNFAIGQGVQVFTVYVKGDTIYEQDEQFTVALSNPTQATLGLASSRGIILNDDISTVPKTIAIAPLSADKAEGNGGYDSLTQYTFTVTRSGPLDGNASVNWSVPNATVISGGPDTGTTATRNDFNSSAQDGTINFANGESSKLITVTVVGDLVAEKDQSFTVHLANAVGASITTADATGIIRNDDFGYSISPTTISKSEGNTGTTIYEYAVTRDSQLSSQASTVQWEVKGQGAFPATVGTDIVSGQGNSIGTINFAIGELSKTIQVKVNGDTTSESNEEFSVELSAPSAGIIINGKATGVIVNDDAARVLPTLSIAPLAANVFEGDSGSTPMTFLVTRSGDTTEAASARWNFSLLPANDTNADLNDVSGNSAGAYGTVSFATGQTTAIVTVNVAGDTVIEKDEIVKISLDNPIGANIVVSEATGKILNDDGQPKIAISPVSISKSEGSSGTTTYQYLVVRTGDLTQTSTVHWSVSGKGTTPATPATDFVDVLDSTFGDLTFITGEASKFIEVKVLGDTVVEPNEQFQIQLSNPVGAIITASTATGDINNDDVEMPSLSIAATSAVRYEGSAEAVPFTFTVTRTGNLNLVSQATWTVAGTGTNAANVQSDFAGTTTAPTGTVIFEAGKATALITVMVNNDLVKELDETFKVSLSNPDKAVISTASANGTIINDDYAGALTIAGTAESGQTLSLKSTVDFGSGLNLIGYQWKLDGVVIAGANGESLVVSESQIGKKISVSANYQGSAGPLSVQSATTANVQPKNTAPKGSVTIDGAQEFNSTLTARNTLSDLDGLGTITYQWNADNTAIPGATASSLQISESLFGKSLSVTASYIDGLGKKEQVSSANTAIVKPLFNGGSGADIFSGSTFNDLIYGNAGNDQLSGASGNDAIFGGDGNDVITGGAGDDLMTGGTGFDTAIFSGKLADYTVNMRSGQINDKRGIDGIDLFNEIEKLKFSDLTVNSQIKSQFADIPQVQAKALVELYIAFFQRIPDADGLAYWISEVKSGKSLPQIANSFYQAGIEAPSLTGYSPNMSNSDFINLIYKNVLGRTGGADAGGLSYWNNELTTGHSSRGDLVVAILNSAHTFKGHAEFGKVADLLDNRYEVSKILAVDMGIGYNSTEAAITKTKAALALVTTTDTQSAIDLIGIPASGFIFG